MSEKYDIPARQFNVTEIFVHPLFDVSKKYDDIALLKLEHPIEFSVDIRPVCLADLNRELPQNLTVAGWGRIDYAGKVHSHLQRVQQTSVPHSECSTHYADRITSRTLDKGIIDDTQLCAMAREGEPDACQVEIVLNHNGNLNLSH